MNDVQENAARQRRPSANREADRERMVAAAAAIIEREGVAGLTARAVAQEAGTALGSLYNVFDGLEALRLEANALTMRDLRQVLAVALDQCAGAPPAERLIALADAYAGFARNRRKAWEAMLAPRTVEVPPAIGEEIAGLFGLIGQVLREGDVVAERDIPVAVKALWASVHGMVQLGESDSMGPIASGDLPAMIRLLVTSAVRGLVSERNRTA